MLWPYNSRYEQRNTAVETRGVAPSKKKKINKQKSQQIIPGIFETCNKMVKTRIVYNLTYKSVVSTPQIPPLSYSASFSDSVHIAPALHNQRRGAHRQASHEPSSLVSVTGSQKQVWTAAAFDSTHMEPATCNNERHAFLQVLCFTRECNGKQNIEIMQSDVVNYIAIVTSQKKQYICCTFWTQLLKMASCENRAVLSCQ